MNWMQHPRLSIRDPRHSLARERARTTGNRYYQGAVCQEGHDGLRYTSTANCVDCQKATRRRQLDRIAAGKVK